MERKELVRWVKFYNKFYSVKDADDWSRELDLKRRQKTNPKDNCFLVGTILRFLRYLDVNLARFTRLYWRAGPSMRRIVRLGCPI